MIATDFTRDDCKLGNKRINYAKLQRDYRCSDCGSRLVMKWAEACELYPENWYVGCQRACNGRNFIHETKAKSEQTVASRAFDSLPEETKAAYIEKRRLKCLS